MNGLTNATSQDVAWGPKHQTAKWCWFDGHSLTRIGSQKIWIFISLHRLQIRHSKILLILARPLPIGYFTFYYFSFFFIFNRMDAWSLMRGDAFIYFVCGSRRVNIRLRVLLLIPKSPQWLECSPMAQETWAQSQVKSYQRLKKYYLIPPCLTLSNIRYVSRV